MGNTPAPPSIPEGSDQDSDMSETELPLGTSIDDMLRDDPESLHTWCAQRKDSAAHSMCNTYAARLWRAKALAERQINAEQYNMGFQLWYSQWYSREKTPRTHIELYAVHKGYYKFLKETASVWLEKGANIDAGKYGHLNDLENMSRFVNVNLRLPDSQRTLLMALSKHATIPEWLLRNRYLDVNARDAQGQTALMQATHENLVKLLSHRDIDVNIHDNNGRTAVAVVLTRKSYADKVNDMKALLELGDPNALAEPQEGTTLLMYTVGNHPGSANKALSMRECLEITKALLAHPKIDVNMRNAKGETALMYVISHSYRDRGIELVRLLLGHDDIDVNLTDYDRGKTALHCAVFWDHAATVAILLQHRDIDVNAKDKDGRTPLMIVESQHLASIKTLLTHEKINVNAQDNDKRTPLIYAVISVGPEDERVKLVRVLLQRGGINLNLADMYGKTALHHAVKRGDKAVVAMLLQHGYIHVNAKDLFGHTALMLSVNADHDPVGMIRLLLDDENVDVNAQNADGATALMLAVRRDNVQAVQLFLKDARIDIAVKDDRGQTALKIAQGQAPSHDRDRIIQLLSRSM